MSFAATPGSSAVGEGGSADQREHEPANTVGLLTRIAPWLLALFVLLAYSRTFGAPFVFDDRRMITENPLVRDLSVFVSPAKANASGANASQMSGHWTRWFAMLTLAVDYHFHGSRPIGFHATNFAIHLLATLILFDLVRRTLRLPTLAASRLATRPDGLALLVAAVFALHPIQTQAVTYIVQRMASLAAALCLVALWGHLRARTSSGWSARIAFALLSAVSLVLAMLSKQNAMTFPVVMLLYDRMLIAERRRLGLRWLALPLLATLIVPLETFWLSKRPGGGVLSSLSAASRETEKIGRDEYLYTQTRVIATYLRLLVLPVGQNLDHDVRLSHSWREPKVIACSLLLLTLVGLACRLVLIPRGSDPGWRLVGVGILWFFVQHVVESGLVPIVDLMFEHRLYLPSVGIILAAVCASFLLVAERHWRLVGASWCAASIVLGCATFARNEIWRDELRLWRDALAKSPNKVRVTNNTGTALIERRRFAEAERMFHRSLELEPRNHTALRSMGRLARERGAPDEAEHFYGQALEAQGDDWISMLNLGDLALERGDRARATQLYQQAAAHERGARLSRERLELARSWSKEGKPVGAVLPIGKEVALPD